MASSSGGAMEATGAGARGGGGGGGGGPGRTGRMTGDGGSGGPQAVAEKGRSRLGGGLWSSHPISADEVVSLRRRFPRILELSEELVKPARCEWEQVTVIARSLGHRVPAEWMAKDISARLGLGYDGEVFILGHDHLALRFRSAVDRDRALTGGPWVVAGQLMALEAWRSDFVPGPGLI